MARWPLAPNNNRSWASNTDGGEAAFLVVEVDDGNSAQPPTVMVAMAEMPAPVADDGRGHRWARPDGTRVRAGGRAALGDVQPAEPERRVLLDSLLPRARGVLGAVL